MSEIKCCRIGVRATIGAVAAAIDGASDPRSSTSCGRTRRGTKAKTNGGGNGLKCFTTIINGGRYRAIEYKSRVVHGVKKLLIRVAPQIRCSSKWRCLQWKLRGTAKILGNQEA